MKSQDISQEHIAEIAKIFPNAITEQTTNDGIHYCVDFGILKQDLSSSLASETKERYQMTWPGKREAMALANASINATLRPMVDKSKDFLHTKNLYIEGDNLSVLKLLGETYLHKIDAIYIDPPYNTGNNLIYKNDFSKKESDFLEESGALDEDNKCLVTNPQSNGRFHSDWLNMMYPRLCLAKNLLASDGVIVVTIDDCEIDNLKKICNEIFGEQNYLGTIVIKNNPSGRSTVSGISISHEYALFYGANSDVKLGRLNRNQKQIERYKESDSYGQFEWVNFRKHGGYKEDAPTMYYPIYIKKDGSDFRIPKLKFDNEKKEYIVLEKPNNDEFISYPIDEDGRARRWKWSLERTLVSKSDMEVRNDVKGIPAVYIKSRMNDDGMLPLTVWDDKKYSSTEYGNNLLIDLFDGKKLFDYPKSLYAVEDCIKVATSKKNAIILDFFSGSGTTAHAVMDLNAQDGGERTFILVQVPEECKTNSLAYSLGYKTICDIGEERIRKAGIKIQTENPLTTQHLDAGFRTFKIDSSNMKEIYYSSSTLNQDLLDNLVSNIKEDRQPIDLIYQIMLELGLPLSSSIESQVILNKRVYFVQDNNMIACFDADLNEALIEKIASYKPLYVCFRNSSFLNDSCSVNCEQIFKTISPITRIKVI